jgi:FkbM family methyltransferase
VTHSDGAFAPPQTILHLGAGTGTRLAEHRDTGASQILLVEAGAAAFAALARAAQGQPGVQAVHAAVGLVEGEGQLNCWNLARLNSLREPTDELRALYPGLRLKERQPVAVTTPARLLAAIGPILRPSVLVIETPGSEGDVIEALARDGLLEQVDRIELHAPEIPLYADAPARSDLEGVLRQAGFDLAGRSLDDPDWPILHFRADHAARALARAEAQVAQLTAALADRDAALAAATDRAATLDGALAEAHREAAEAQRSLSELQAGHAQLVDKAAWRKSELDRLTAALADRDAALAAATDRAATLDGALAEARATAHAQSLALADREAALASALGRVAALEAALAEADATAAAQARSLIDRDAALASALERTAAIEAALTEARATAEAAGQSFAALQSEHQQLVEKAAWRKTEIERREAECRQLTGERDQANRSLEALQRRIDESEHRLRVSRDDLRRAEGQISLIADLLLREAGL